LNIIVRITNVPQVDGEKYIGGSEHVDSCYLQLVPKENGMELTPQQVYELSFIGTTGTVKRTAKDRIEVTAEMKDDQGNDFVDGEYYFVSNNVDDGRLSRENPLTGLHQSVGKIFHRTDRKLAIELLQPTKLLPYILDDTGTPIPFVPEAPADGNAYGRKDNGWVEVKTVSEIENDHYLKSEFIAASAGHSSAGKPVIVNSNGWTIKLH